ncbi:MAG: hypothetical protein AAF826_07460 [Pseudomonadota bacterium]
MTRCLTALMMLAAGPIWAHDITYPSFIGTLNVTTSNSTDFLDFAAQYQGQVVYLDIDVTYSFGNEDHYTANAACNAENDFWNDGFTDNRFVMPLQITATEGTPLTADDVICADIPMTFKGLEVSLSSGGPGAHWYEIEGFFLMRERVDRWPYIEFQWLEADAETWASVVNRAD